MCVSVSLYFLFLRDIYTGNDRGMEYVPISVPGGADMDTRPHTLTDLAGPLCFAGDYLQQQIQFPTLEEGDEVLLLNTGSNAYGLWSRHCSRTIPKVMGVDFDTDMVLQMSPRTTPYVSVEDEDSWGGRMYLNSKETDAIVLPWQVTETGTTKNDDDDDTETMEEEEEEETTTTTTATASASAL